MRIMCPNNVKRFMRSLNRSEETTLRFGLGVLAYLVPTFALGFVWHLVLFQHSYEA